MAVINFKNITTGNWNPIGGSSLTTVSFMEAQELTEEQKAQARANINATSYSGYVLRIDENGELIIRYDEASGNGLPPLSIKEGQLVYTIA